MTFATRHAHAAYERRERHGLLFLTSCTCSLRTRRSGCGRLLYALNRMHSSNFTLCVTADVLRELWGPHHGPAPVHVIHQHSGSAAAPMSSVHLWQLGHRSVVDVWRRLSRVFLGQRVLAAAASFAAAPPAAAQAAALHVDRLGGPNRWLDIFCPYPYWLDKPARLDSGGVTEPARHASRSCMAEPVKQR